MKYFFSMLVCMLSIVVSYAQPSTEAEIFLPEYVLHHKIKNAKSTQYFITGVDSGKVKTRKGNIEYLNEFDPEGRVVAKTFFSIDDLPDRKIAMKWSDENQLIEVNDQKLFYVSGQEEPRVILHTREQYDPETGAGETRMVRSLIGTNGTEVITMEKVSIGSKGGMITETIIVHNHGEKDTALENSEWISDSVRVQYQIAQNGDRIELYREIHDQIGRLIRRERNNAELFSEQIWIYEKDQLIEFKTQTRYKNPVNDSGFSRTAYSYQYDSAGLLKEKVWWNINLAGEWKAEMISRFEYSFQ